VHIVDGLGARLGDGTDEVPAMSATIDQLAGASVYGRAWRR